jgi:plastocyanin domain-containing protein
VKITITDMGYEPSNIKLKAGVPVRMVFDQHGTTECSSKVMIPDFGIEKTEIPTGDPTSIEFTPEADGEFTFTCGMKMLKGTLMVEG